MHEVSITPGTPEVVMGGILAAVDIFPLNHNVRRMPIYLAVKLPLPSATVESILIETLKNDPHSPDLERQLADIRRLKQ